jgi:hypothetical protein
MGGKGEYLKEEKRIISRSGFYVLNSHNNNVSLDAILGRILQLQLHLYSYIA